MRRITLLIIGLVIAVGVLGFFVWRQYHTRISSMLPSDNNGQPAVIPEWYATDKDGDRIPDAEEQKLGTSINETDTDGDGLSDYQEINQSKTDPTKADTDGDGYPDGLELLQGHDPLKK